MAALKEKNFGVVQRTFEFERIFSLPRRQLDLENALDVTDFFLKRPDLDFKLRPAQSAALIEAAEQDGLFCDLPVGAGKALICLLLPYAMNAKRAVIMTEPKLKRLMIRQAYEFYGRFLSIPFDRFQIVAYSELSSATKAEILEELQPDLLICDEAHCLKLPQSARTKRFLRYAKNHPNVRYAFLSGTIMHRSINDFAHLIELALKKNSPLPRGYRELQTWSGALDVAPAWPTSPGVLYKFCEGKETVREGFRRRLVETPGVVGDPRPVDVGASLIIRKQSLAIPKIVMDLISGVQKNWKLGDKEMNLALEQSAVMQQLSSGFFYKWVWPNGKPDTEWLEIRAEWMSEVREKLKRARPGLDSPFLLERAAKRHFEWRKNGGDKPDGAMWDSEFYPEWQAVKDRARPKTETIWVHDFLIDFSIDWAHKHSDRRAILWYAFSAVGEKLFQKGGFPFYGPAREAELADPEKEPVIVCSIKAQGTGQNLQKYSANLFTALRPNGLIFEQTVGRTHRPGQMADEVLVDWIAHSPEALAAMEMIQIDAKFQEETRGVKQKVLYASHI